MHLILGGTGHVGSAVAKALLQRGEPVTILTHDNRAATAEDWQRMGAEVALVDIHDVETLRFVFQKGKRLFLLNPPADPSTDTDTEEHKSLKSIFAALEGSGLEKIVAQSAYGAQPAQHLGDLGTLYDMEQELKTQSIPFSVLRAAYFMSNWDSSLETARKDGVVNSFFPADFVLPMVAPRDIGNVASRLLTEPASSTRLYNVEGPERYTIADVADAFSRALEKPVTVAVIPRERWLQAYRELGFSEAAASSFAAMTAATLDAASFPDSPQRGDTSLREYVFERVRKNQSETA